MTNGEIREACLTLDRDLTTDGNRGIEPRVIIVKTTMTSRFREYVRINPPIFLCYKVGEDPQELLEVCIMCLVSLG